MKSIYRFSAIALLAIGLFVWWYYQTPRTLARKIDGLISTLRFDTATSRSSRLIKSSSIGQYFDEQVEISSPIENANGNFSPEELNSGYGFLTENAREITIQRVTDIACAISDQHATQRFEVDARVSVSQWIKNLDGHYAITVHWRKTTHGWRIHSSDWKEIP
jgi:hypothetical protein